MIRNSKRNCINLKEDELQIPIYRVFSIDRLIEMFETKKLTLVRPHKWDDPFENYVFNKLSKTQKTDKKNKFFEVYKNSLYGQCWTFLKESDAIWRIYAPSKNGVKVKTTIHNLLETIQLESYAIAEMSCYISKVIYEGLEKLEKIYEELTSNFEEQTPEGIWKLVNSITIKRPEFAHEEEVRLIYFESWGNSKSDTVSFALSPGFQFDEIIFDPRMPDSIYETYKDRIQNFYNYPMKIDKSQLYTLPKFTLK
jgi:hypothetical protein